MNRDQIETLKHNAKLDVRLPDQLKNELLTRCREDGVSSGAVIRSLIIGHVSKRPGRWPAWLTGLKERIVTRSRWMLGAAGGGAVAAMSALGLVFAPTASAEDVRVEFELEIAIGGERESFSGEHVTAVGERWLLFPQDEAGAATYAVNMLVRACSPDELEADPDCEIVFDIEFFEVLGYEDNQWGGVNITGSRSVAHPTMTGTLGQTLNYFSVIEDGGATLTMKTLASVS